VRFGKFTDDYDISPGKNRFRLNKIPATNEDDEFVYQSATKTGEKLIADPDFQPFEGLARSPSQKSNKSLNCRKSASKYKSPRKKIKIHYLDSASEQKSDPLKNKDKLLAESIHIQSQVKEAIDRVQQVRADASQVIFNSGHLLASY
jgi:hypothetical protein|tara:strand:- start:1784 stop:2224 length:441 start_codon:yes stop_codon:yes gene_type:complete